jgi:hypothetical protein
MRRCGHHWGQDRPSTRGCAPARHRPRADNYPASKALCACAVLRASAASNGNCRTNQTCPRKANSQRDSPAAAAPRTSRSGAAVRFSQRQLPRSRDVDSRAIYVTCRWRSATAPELQRGVSNRGSGLPYRPNEIPSVLGLRIPWSGSEGPGRIGGARAAARSRQVYGHPLVDVATRSDPRSCGPASYPDVLDDFFFSFGTSSVLISTAPISATGQSRYFVCSMCSTSARCSRNLLRRPS